MSGTGLKFKITSVIEHLEEEKGKFGDMSEETSVVYNDTIFMLKYCEISVHRFDYLFEGDDGEDSFLERWYEDMRSMKWENK